MKGHGDLRRHSTGHGEGFIHLRSRKGRVTPFRLSQKRGPSSLLSSGRKDLSTTLTRSSRLVGGNWCVGLRGRVRGRDGTTVVGREVEG